jgi:hypothetical protein
MGHDVDGATVLRSPIAAARALCAVCSGVGVPPSLDSLESDSRSPRGSPRMASSASAAPARDKRIKVCVRLRPFTRTEKLKAGGKAAWTWCDPIPKSPIQMPC